LLFVGFPCCIVALVQGECALAQGELAYVQGVSLCCLSFGLVVCALCLGCVELLPLPKGSEICSSSSDLALCLSLAFDRFLEFLFIRFFSFSFLSGYYMCLLSMHSSRGRLRTMCGSRTGGWSLPSVMSD
jgi:hypothetical protein